MRLPSFPFYPKTPEAQAALNKTLKKSFEDAFLAIASRSAGSVYRIADAYNPQLQDNNVTPRPELVVNRELITLVLAFGFGLLSSPAMTLLSTFLKIQSEAARKFLVVVTASAIAEGVSRAFVYRALDRKPKTHPSAYPPVSNPPSGLAGQFGQPMPSAFPTANAFNLLSPALMPMAPIPSAHSGPMPLSSNPLYAPARQPLNNAPRPLAFSPVMASLPLI
jgi:hypothetical protein